MNEAEILGGIPGLTIGEMIGSGGMGAVYKAYQPVLDRTVALKTVRPDLLTEEALDLFQREAQALARIRHARIVQILEFHPEHGVPYFLMEYVDGIALDEAVRGRSWKEQSALFREVVSTVMAAHEAGVVHGDLKPSNILVDRRGQPFVLDFGVAQFSRSNGKTATPAASGGTPAYLAPEVLGGGEPSSVQSDVFALGVTLYVLLTGVLPFRGPLHALGGNPKVPVEHNPDIPEPLQRICLKAMESDPADRYQTAELLHADLSRFLAGKPIYARPTLYKTELAGRVRNHVAELELWEKEGFISRRERDALVLPYDQLREQDSPWLSETRRVLTGPLLMRVGAWLVVLATLLWPLFYWALLSQTQRVAGAVLPATLMATLGVWFLVRNNRKNALACLGSFAMLLFVLSLVLLSEFQWLRYPQPPQWELWGAWVEEGPLKQDRDDLERAQKDPGAKAAPGDTPNPDDDRQEEKPGAMREDVAGDRKPLGERPTLQRWQEGKQRWLDALESYEGFILSNTQICAALGVVTLCLALLMFLLKAPFYAPWLALSAIGFSAAALLLLGDKERLMEQRIAWVGVHGVVISAIFFLAGTAVEWATAARVARSFYWAATILCVLSAVTVAAFGTNEWFKETWSWHNVTLNFWLMAYSLPFLLCGFLSERFGMQGHRNLSWVYYYLFPLFLLFPLNMLAGRGWELGTLGERPVDIYEVSYLLACVALLAVGRLLHTRVTILVGLWGIAFFVFRTTERHLVDYLGWPLALAVGGSTLIFLGIVLPVWRQQNRARSGIRRKLVDSNLPTEPGAHEAETLAVPRSE